MGTDYTILTIVMIENRQDALQLTLAGDENALVETAFRGRAVTVATTTPHIALDKDRILVVNVIQP